MYSGQIGVYETTNNYFRLSDVTFVDNNTPNPITYVKPGGTYNIRLKVKRNGQYSCWGFYNLDPTTLNIPQAGTPYFYIKAVDSPRILNSNKPSVPCGGTFPDRDLTQIEAKNSVQIPTLNNFTYFTPYNYRWRVTREDDGLVTEFNSPTNLILFKTLVTYNPLGIGLDTPEGWQFIKPNKTYKFEIGALYPDGTKHFSQYGICYFKTANFPLRPANTTNTTEKEDNVTKVFEAQAYPNPSANSFMINIQSSSKEKITIAVYNNVGLLIDTKVVASDFPTQEIGANYNKGFYTVIVSQGDTVKKLKLIKQ